MAAGLLGVFVKQKHTQNTGKPLLVRVVRVSVCVVELKRAARFIALRSESCRGSGGTCLAFLRGVTSDVCIQLAERLGPIASVIRLCTSAQD